MCDRSHSRFLHSTVVKARYNRRKCVYFFESLAHQEDNVGVLVESSGHTDSLSLTSAQVDALNRRNT